MSSMRSESNRTISVAIAQRPSLMCSKIPGTRNARRPTQAICRSLDRYSSIASKSGSRLTKTILPVRDRPQKRPNTLEDQFLMSAGKGCPHQPGGTVDCHAGGSTVEIEQVWPPEDSFGSNPPLGSFGVLVPTGVIAGHRLSWPTAPVENAYVVGHPSFQAANERMLRSSRSKGASNGQRDQHLSRNEQALSASLAS